MVRLIIFLLPCLFSLACSPKAEIDDIITKPELVTVAGRVIDPLPDSKRIALAINRLGVGQEEIESEIDNEGKFQFEFETYTPTDIWLTYQTNLLFVVHPGDSVSVEFNGSIPHRPELLGTIKFSGDRATTNNQIAAFQKAYLEMGHNWQQENNAIKKYGPEEFKAYADTIRLIETNLYDGFIKRHSPNDEAANWALSRLSRNHFVRLTSYPNAHRMALVLKEGEWNVPISYYDYVKTTTPISRSLLSADAIYDVTNSYLYRYLRQVVNERLVRHEATDSEYIRDSIFLQTISEYTPDPQFREIAITQYLNDNLSGLKLEAYERNLDFIEANVKQPFLIEPLRKRYSVVSRKVNELPIPENAWIQNISDSSNAFINKVISDNKGRIIYIDIWATWCRPCLEQFPYSKKLQNGLTDVTFVYMCIESDRTAFENTIKRFQLGGQHYFLNNRQSTAFRRELNIDGIPHYLLIDRNGKVINANFELQPSSDQTKRKLEDLLE